jgi:type VI secretion system secreted protein Hcp
MPIYMNYQAPTAITGDVTETNHTGWIELNSLQWGVGRSISMATGSVADQSPSTPSFSEVVVTKDSDDTSYQLLQQAYQGTGCTVVIDFVRTPAGGSPVVYLEITLTNCMISGFSTSSGGDAPSESLTLSYTAIQYMYTPSGGTGAQGSQSGVSYDLGTCTMS